MEILEIHSLDALAGGGHGLPAGGGCNVPAGGGHEMPANTVSGATPYIPSEVMVADLLGLMNELDPTLEVTPAMLQDAAGDPDTHLFVAVEDGHVIGTASLCVFRTPTGTKGRIEDVVVSHEYRGLGLGKHLLEYMIEFARECFSRAGLAPIELQLTSRPSRVAANQLYRSLGFLPYETNVYKMKVR